MIEVVYFPVHGDKRGGTGVAVYGGFGYGQADVDPVTLKPDRPTDLFAPSLTTEVEEAARRAHGDRWIHRSTINKSVHAPRIKAAGKQPPTVALTADKRVERGHRAVAAKAAAALAKARRQVAKVQKAIQAGRLSPKDARAKALRAAEHGMRMRQVAHEAYNSIAVLEARILQDKQAGVPGKALAAHRRVLAKMRVCADRLASIAARDQALQGVSDTATLSAARQAGMADYIQLEGFGQNQIGDSRDIEEQGAELIAQATEEIAAGNVGAAEVTIANAEGTFKQADTARSAEAAAGDVFAQVTEALEPRRVPWGPIAVGVLIIAALRQATR